MLRNSNSSLDLDGVSNLAITDHLPADLIRSFWLIQSLNIEVGKKQHDLDQLLDLLSIFDKISDASRPCSIDSDESILRQSPNDEAEKNCIITMEKERSIILGRIDQLKSQITRLFNESTKESQTIIDNLISSRESLFAYTYYSIRNLFNTSKINLPDIERLTPADFLQYDKDIPLPSMSKIKRMYSGIDYQQLEANLNKRDAKQRPNTDAILNYYGENTENIRELINQLSLERTSSNFESEKKLFEDYQKVLAIIIKNRLYDKQNFMNNFQRTKLKVIFKSLQSMTTESSTPSSSASPLSSLSSTLKPTTINTSILSPVSYSSTTATTPRIRLTFKAFSKEPTPEITSPLTPFLDMTDSVQDIEHLLPENHSKLKNLRNSEENSEVTNVEGKAKDEDDEVYCICRQPSFGKMIGCDNKKCEYGWFHYKCIGLKSTFKPPKNKPWYCRWCAPLFERPKKKPTKLYSSKFRFKSQKALVPTKADEIGFNEMDINEIIMNAKKKSREVLKIPESEIDKPARRTRSRSSKQDSALETSQSLGDGLIARRLRPRSTSKTGTIDTSSVVKKIDTSSMNIISSRQGSRKITADSKTNIGASRVSFPKIFKSSSKIITNNSQPISGRLRNSNVNEKKNIEQQQNQKFSKTNEESSKSKVQKRVRKSEIKTPKKNIHQRFLRSRDYSVDNTKLIPHIGDPDLLQRRRSPRFRTDHYRNVAEINVSSKTTGMTNLNSKIDGLVSFMENPVAEKSNSVVVTRKMFKSTGDIVKNVVSDPNELSKRKTLNFGSKSNTIKNKKSSKDSKMRKPTHSVSLRRRNLRSASAK